MENRAMPKTTYVLTVTIEASSYEAAGALRDEVVGSIEDARESGTVEGADADVSNLTERTYDDVDLDLILSAAREVVRRWSRSNLSEAVNDLQQALKPMLTEQERAEAALELHGYEKNAAGLWEDPDVGEDGVSDPVALCEQEDIDY